MDVKKVGEFIKQKRKEKNLTQKELAVQLSITDRAISKWERGICCPDISLLKQLSSILEVNINELLSGEDIEKLELKQTENILVETVKQYSSVEKKKNRKLLLFTIIFLIFCIALVFAIYLTYNQLNKNDKVNWNTYTNKRVLDKFFTALENYDYETLKKMQIASYSNGKNVFGDIPFEEETRCNEYREQRKNGERLYGPGVVCMLKYFEENGLKFLSHEYLYQTYIDGSGEWATNYEIIAEYKETKIYLGVGGFVRNGIIAETFGGFQPEQEDQFFSINYPEISDKIYYFFGGYPEWEE